MPSFSRSSQSRLLTCHDDIQKIMNIVIKNYDCSIIEGIRSIERQTELFNSGRSKTMNSKHLPHNGVSLAIDVVPYPISWGKKEHDILMNAIMTRNHKDIQESLKSYNIVYARFYHFAGYVTRVADELGIDIRWGGDWDSDNVFNDQTFFDLPHFELRLQ